MTERPQVVRRAFLASATVLTAGTLALVVTPATVSFPPRPGEVAVLAGGLAVLLLLDLVLLRRSLGRVAPTAREQPRELEPTLAPLPAEAEADAVLAATEDYLVDSPAGEVGVVDEVVVGDDGRVSALVVRCGWFGRERCVIERSRIVEVRRDTRTILVLP